MLNLGELAVTALEPAPFIHEVERDQAAQQPADEHGSPSPGRMLADDEGAGAQGSEIRHYG